MDLTDTATASVPAHIAIIMDGNGRWANKRGLARSIGHRQGTKTLRPIVRRCQKLGVSYLTLYTFSTENWNRPADEIAGIMKLLREHFKEAERYASENIRIRVIGDISRLEEDLQKKLLKAEADSANNTGMTLCFALNYGGRQEIIHAVRSIASAVQSGELQPEAIDEAAFQQHLYTFDIPDPDLILRPSGEQRLSNFLLWQCAYSEFIFMDVLWPDFTPRDLDLAIAEYTKRHRRFGGIG